MVEQGWNWDIYHVVIRRRFVRGGSLHFLSAYGRPQKFFQKGQRRHFAYPFQVADDAIQLDVHKTFYSFYTIKKMPYGGNSHKIAIC